MEDKFPIGTKVVLKLPSDPQKSDRVYYLLNTTGATFAHKVYGVVISKNSDRTYSVKWNTQMPSLAYRQFTSVYDAQFGTGDIVEWILSD